MRVWADVYDAYGSRQGDGPITAIRAASINRTLDASGDFNIDISGGDGRALAILQPERRVIVWIEDNGHPRQLFQGIIQNLTWQESDGGRSYSVSGSDIMNELTRANLFYGAVYNNETAQDILTAAFSHVPQWELVCSDTTQTTLQFNGASVFTVLREVRKSTGQHFRLEDGRRLAFGAFGDSSGLRIYQGSQNGYENKNVATITRLEYRINSDNIANAVSPAGAKDGSTYLGMGLIYGTPQTPFTVRQGINEFGAYYYLADEESIYSYGRIEKVLSYPNIKAASASIDDQTAGANALYQATSKWLERNREPQKFYGCQIKNVFQTIYPGQKVFLQYKGDAWQGEKRTWPVDIRDELWVIRASERFDQGGLTLDLELSEIDQIEQNDDEFIASFLDEVNRLE